MEHTFILASLTCGSTILIIFFVEICALKRFLLHLLLVYLSQLIYTGRHATDHHTKERLRDDPESGREGHYQFWIYLVITDKIARGSLYFPWIINPACTSVHWNVIQSHFTWQPTKLLLSWVRFPLMTTFHWRVTFEEVLQVICNKVFHLCTASSRNLALVGRRLFIAGCLTRFFVKWRKWTGVAANKQMKLISHREHYPPCASHDLQ